MQYSNEVKDMVCVAKGPKHGPAPIPEEGLWVEAKQITDISGLSPGLPFALKIFFTASGLSASAASP